MTPMPWEQKPSAELLNQFRAPEHRNRSGRPLDEVIRDFNEGTPILSLFGEDVKRVATTNGGEYAGPCPLCQGTDRLRVWPSPRQGSPRAWCRHCRFEGDSLRWTMRIGGCDPSVSGAVGAFLVDRGFLSPTSAPRRIGREVIATAMRHPRSLDSINAETKRTTEQSPTPSDLQELGERSQSDQSNALFTAWDKHLGYAPVTVADLIRHAEQNAGLRAALGQAAGDAEALQTYLLSFTDLTVGGHRIVPVGPEDAVVPDDGELRWRLASILSIDLASKRVKSGELFDNREVDL